MVVHGIADTRVRNPRCHAQCGNTTDQPKVGLTLTARHGAKMTRTESNSLVKMLVETVTEPPATAPLYVLTMTSEASPNSIVAVLQADSPPCRCPPENGSHYPRGPAVSRGRARPSLHRPTCSLTGFAREDRLDAAQSPRIVVPSVGDHQPVLFCM